MRYRAENKKKSHVFSIYSLEQSDLEFHNYLVGCFEDVPGASSIKLTSLETVRILNEKASYSSNFEECYRAMKQNGIQFGISEIKYWKVYLDEESLKAYHGHYLDRPRIYEKGSDEQGSYCLFNCSEFQLKNYFKPFDSDIQIEEYKTTSYNSNIL